MTARIRAAAVAAVVATVAGCATGNAVSPLPVVATGPAQSCVLVQNLRGTEVRDDWTIDFTLRDGSVLRNRLPARCPQLGFSRAFTYATGIPQLCNVDIITVLLLQAGLARGASCPLGSFVPIDPKATAVPAN